MASTTFTGPSFYVKKGSTNYRFYLIGDDCPKPRMAVKNGSNIKYLPLYTSKSGLTGPFLCTKRGNTTYYTPKEHVPYIRPVEWIMLSDVDAMNPGGKQLKWNGYDALYVYCGNSMNNPASPGDTSSWNSICTLEFEYGQLKLGLGKWDGFNLGLMWIMEYSGNIAGSIQIDTECTVESYGGGGYGVTIAEPLDIPTTMGDVILSGYGDGVVAQDILVQKI